ncbi:MAG: transcriptional regulator [Planctomycetaceae bacterium]|nr:transcriptional regulator [Planctomycetaceae bacterium]
MSDAAQRTADPNRVPLLDIVSENRPFNAELLAAIGEVLNTGRFLYGPPVQQLEEAIATKCEVKHAIGCSSGSDALLVSLMALDVGRGDEVILPSFTFFATASCVWRLGAKVVFVDIDPATFNLAPEQVEAAITPNTKAVIPVDLYGRCADLTRLTEIAQKNGIHLVEDAAQSIGASHQDRPAGAWGTVGCFSFYPTKNLGACGDAGIMTTSDDELAERLRLFGAHGMNPRYVHKVVGIASRIDSIQAAALCVKLKQLGRWTEMRRENALRYQQLFESASIDGEIVLPTDDPSGRHVWNQYTIRVPDGRRDALRAHLAAESIGSEVYYPIPLHRQECFAELGYSVGSLPETERAANEVLSLPIFPGLTAGEQERVVDSVSRHLAGKRASAA